MQCMFVSLAQVSVVYAIKEIAGGLGQLMGVARNRTHARALVLYIPTGRKLLVAIRRNWK